MMLTISTDEGGTWFKPGESIRGNVFWQLEEEPDAVEVRLFWYTEGKGTRDVEVVSSKHLAQPGLSGSCSFDFDVPRGPYSFSGRLITLSWAIELVAQPSGETERFDLIVGPQPVEVDLR